MADHQELIIKKVKKGGDGHHGGAWKIAYADFVTAMMAFFLLLWLINMTTPVQKKGIADYFAPPAVSTSTMGAGAALAGTAYATDPGAKMSGATTDDKTFTSPANTKQGPLLSVKGGSDAIKGIPEDSLDATKTDAQATYSNRFKAAAESIRQAWQAMPEVTAITQNLKIEETKDGLNIVIMDEAGRRMFPEKSKYPVEPVREAVAAMAPILQRLPNQITITGHTAAGTQFDDPHYSTWNLSLDRADVIRQILGEFGLSADRVAAVTGRASRQPLFAEDPFLAANERVEITVLFAPPPVPPNLTP